MTPADRTVLAKLLALRHRTTPQTNRFRLRKAMNTDFVASIEARGQATSPAKKEVLKGFGTDLKAFAGEDSGGILVEWNAAPGQRPIIWLSNEGQVAIAGRHAREMFGMLARCGGKGWGFWDAISHAAWELLALDVEKAERPAPPVVDGEQAELDDEVVTLLASLDVPVVDDVLGTARAAARQFLWPFIDRLDTIVCGYNAQHVWHDAWNKPDASLETARAFSPKERYKDGERVTYVFHNTTLAPRRAVVLAHPQPTRVLLADRSTTFMRAYT